MTLGVRSFKLCPTDRVLQGPGALRAVPDELRRRGVSRAFLVTSASVAAGSVCATLREELGDLLVGEFAAVLPHNPSERVAEAIVRARRAGADVVVGVGGGSAIDAAKLAALGICEGLERPEELRRYELGPAGTREPVGVPPCVIAVPTTLSAAEWTGIAAYVEEERHEKLLAGYAEVTPAVVVLDPEACVETPRSLWATTGARAVDHAVEAVYSSTAHPYATCLALGALWTLARELPRSTRDAGDLESALQCQLAAWMSVATGPNILTGLSHAIGHQLGALGVPHGVTSCLTLPEVMRFLEPGSRTQQALIADVLANAQGDGDRSLSAADRVERLFDELRVPRRIRDVHVTKEQLDDVARATVTRGAFILRAAPRPVDEQDVRALLERVW